MPSLFATEYYNATSAVLLALEAVNGNLEDNQAAFRAALANGELDAPNGRITLDENRQTIGTNLVVEDDEDDEGNLVNHLVRVVEGVDQRLGPTEEQLAEIGLPSAIRRFARIPSRRKADATGPGRRAPAGTFRGRPRGG